MRIRRSGSGTEPGAPPSSARRCGSGDERGADPPGAVRKIRIAAPGGRKGRPYSGAGKVVPSLSRYDMVNEASSSPCALLWTT